MSKREILRGEHNTSDRKRNHDLQGLFPEGTLEQVNQKQTLLRTWLACLLLTSLLLGGKLDLQSSAVAEDSPGRGSFPLEAAAKPAIGHIAGIKLSIPHKYLLSGVHYRGEEVWTKSKTAPPPRTFDSEIQDFSLLLRQSTLRPIETEQDWADYRAYGRTAFPRPENRWLTMSFYPDWYTANGGKLKAVRDRYMKDEPHWGPFTSKDEKVFGLNHAVSIKREEEKSFYLDADELFYDDITWNTFISCSNYHRAVQPFDPLSFCRHVFVLEELNVVVELDCTKDDLSRWHEFELAIRKIALSFVVK